MKTNIDLKLKYHFETGLHWNEDKPAYAKWLENQILEAIDNITKANSNIGGKLDALTELRAQVEPYRNTLVIKDFDNVAMLLNVVELDDDYYWSFYSDKGITHSSCLIEWIPLKGNISQESYDRMVHVWNLNHTKKEIR